MIFHWSLSDSKSPQVSRTLLSILAVLNNAVVRLVSTRPYYYYYYYYYLFIYLFIYFLRYRKMLDEENIETHCKTPFV